MNSAENRATNRPDVPTPDVPAPGVAARLPASDVLGQESSYALPDLFRAAELQNLSPLGRGRSRQVLPSFVLHCVTPVTHGALVLVEIIDVYPMKRSARAA